MYSRYVVVDDKLVPSDIAPLILTEKLRNMTGPPVTALVQFVKEAEWEIPDAVLSAEREAGISAEYSIRIMIEKMAAINKSVKTTVRISVYPGKPGVLVIERI